MLRYCYKDIVKMYARRAEKALCDVVCEIHCIVTRLRVKAEDY